MITRLFKGLLLGLVLGVLAAAALVKGLGMNPSFVEAGGSLVAYTAALGTGTLVGLVAGKPIWAKGAWIEALLKTFFGALLAAGGMLALQKLATFTVDLSAHGLGSGTPGNLAFLALPAIATVLSVFFEIDNTGDDEPAEKGGSSGSRAAKSSKAPNPKLRAPAASSSEGDALDADEPAPSRTAKK